jgi:hypothetical protein
MWCRGLAGSPPPSAATVAQTLRARAATVALDTGKARLCTLSAVTSAARTLPPGSTASKLTQTILPFSTPMLILPYRLPKSCPLTRCDFKKNQMN